MSVIDIQTALDHQRIDADDSLDDAQLKLDAAEQAAMQFLNRNFYADPAALSAARATVPALHAAAVLARDQALQDAEIITDLEYRQLLIDAAESMYLEAKAAINQILLGIVVTTDIKGAVLLTFGHLYENREDVGVSMAELPKGAHSMLWPFRAQLGV